MDEVRGTARCPWWFLLPAVLGAAILDQCEILQDLDTSILHHMTYHKISVVPSWIMWICAIRDGSAWLSQEEKPAEAPWPWQVWETTAIVGTLAQLGSWLGLCPLSVNYFVNVFVHEYSFFQIHYVEHSSDFEWYYAMQATLMVSQFHWSSRRQILGWWWIRWQWCMLVCK